MAFVTPSGPAAVCGKRANSVAISETSQRTLGHGRRGTSPSNCSHESALVSASHPKMGPQ
eukprot:1340463-Amphidinium_carterae.1